MRNVRQAAVPQVQLVTFRVGGEEFGLDVFSVHEILSYQQPTPMPRAPEFVEGVLDVRGIVRVGERLVVLIDLDRILSSEERIALAHADPAGE
ncbi:MAG TPA: chemotaxis protein CheW [Longimicrobium sp.]|nr:chemotaxis protein CheW [Longimicrobium sp.]